MKQTPVAHTPREGSDDWHSYDGHVQGVVDFAVGFAKPLGLEVETDIDHSSDEG